MQARCQFGGLSAEIGPEVEPMIVLCHCLDCQRRSGSLSGEIAYYPQEAVTVSGAACEFTRTTDAGHRFTGSFCPVCGSTIDGRASKYAGIVGTTVGSISDPAFSLPARSVYEQSRHPWLHLPEAIPAHPRGRNS